jgi:recombination protein RecA
VDKKRRRKRQLELTVAQVHLRYGPRSLVKGRTLSPSDTFPHIPTDFSQLDRALGIGGLPKGRVTELVGLPTSGKTTLALKFLAQAQAGGDQVAYIDQARAFDPDYAHRCGLDLSRLLIGRPCDLQEALAMAESLVRSGGLSALVFDALDTLWTTPGTARHLSAFLDRLAAPLSRLGTVLLFLHASSAAESPALSALAHYAAVRLGVSRERWLRRGSDIRGYKARVEVLKNKLGPAGRRVSVTIEFNGTVRGNGL